jgi:hypothetical protein
LPEPTAGVPGESRTGRREASGPAEYVFDGGTVKRGAVLRRPI